MAFYGKRGLTIHVTEILDFGYPQNSEIDTLKMYITTEGVKSELAVVSAAMFNRGLLLTRIAARGIAKDHYPSNWRHELEEK